MLSGLAMKHIFRYISWLDQNNCTFAAVVLSLRKYAGLYLTFRNVTKRIQRRFRDEGFPAKTGARGLCQCRTLSRSRQCTGTWRTGTLTSGESQKKQSTRTQAYEESRVCIPVTRFSLSAQGGLWGTNTKAHDRPRAVLTRLMRVFRNTIWQQPNFMRWPPPLAPMSPDSDNVAEVSNCSCTQLKGEKAVGNKCNFGPRCVGRPMRTDPNPQGLASRLPQTGPKTLYSLSGIGFAPAGQTRLAAEDETGRPANPCWKQPLLKTTRGRDTQLHPTAGRGSSTDLRCQNTREKWIHLPLSVNPIYKPFKLLPRRKFNPATWEQRGAYERRIYTLIGGRPEMTQEKTHTRGECY